MRQVEFYRSVHVIKFEYFCCIFHLLESYSFLKLTKLKYRQLKFFKLIGKQQQQDILISETNLNSFIK